MPQSSQVGQLQTPSYSPPSVVLPCLPETVSTDCGYDVKRPAFCISVKPSRPRRVAALTTRDPADNPAMCGR
jgi:hypothetical protein